MQTQPRITVAICTYNRANYLYDTLHDLSVQSADPDLFEILVINNNSTDHTKRVCDDFIKMHNALNVRVVEEHEQGLSRARNRAAREGSAPVILYIDDDVFLPKNFVETAITYSDSCSAPFCAGGSIDSP